MQRFRQRSATLCLAFGLLAWLFALGADRLHHALVVHVVCHEHGDLLELRASDDGHVHEHAGPVASSELPDPHDHGCSLDALTTKALCAPALALLPPPPVLTATSERVLLDSAPRAPPLAYAPKTSPPLLG